MNQVHQIHSSISSCLADLLDEPKLTVFNSVQQRLGPWPLQFFSSLSCCHLICDGDLEPGFATLGLHTYTAFSPFPEIRSLAIKTSTGNFMAASPA